MPFSLHMDPLTNSKDLGSNLWVPLGGPPYGPLPVTTDGIQVGMGRLRIFEHWAFRDPFVAFTMGFGDHLVTISGL